MVSDAMLCHDHSSAKLHAGEEAVLQYRIDGEIWDLYHTEVPSSQRGKGLGAVLAEVSWVRTL